MTQSLNGLLFKIRFPLLLFGVLSLILGIWGGLQRTGWSLPGTKMNLILLHGPLMVCGFLGTVIGMERAVAQNRFWYYLAPFFTGLGAILLLIGIGFNLPHVFISIGSFVLILNFAVVLQKHPSMHMAVMGTGALLFFIGNIFWLAGFPVFNVVLWWAGFLILTIAGERLELSRILQPPKSVKVMFLIFNIVLVTGIIIATFKFEPGMKLAGAGMLLLSLWLLRHDLARKSIKQAGLPKFIALALIIGYVWLGIAGILALVWGDMAAGPFYDAILHSVFLGFVFSMIFGHAPIIFPAILNVKMEFTNRFYVHLFLLHAALLFRTISDISGWIEGRLWGSMFNGIAILIFFLNTVSSKRKK